MSQTMKPITAAAKLGIYLPAAPESFRNNPITRDELDELRTNPPEWLLELHRNGPFPRDVVARKLGISRSGLARAGVSDAMDAGQIGELLADPPGWLIDERETAKKVARERSQNG
ncbi:MAG: hypothetical protein GX596_08370 [Propionibacterium sp.]|nr:hypothetical protein [Propionibacterium sp.]